MRIRLLTCAMSSSAAGAAGAGAAEGGGKPATGAGGGGGGGVRERFLLDAGAALAAEAEEAPVVWLRMLALSVSGS